MYINHNVFSTDQSLEGLIKKEICSENEASTPKFACTKCNRAFTTNQNLKRHIGSQVCSRPAKRIPDFACANCHRVFATNQNLKDHVEKQICLRNNKSAPIFRCRHCENSFATKQTLQRHLQDRVCFRPSKHAAADFSRRAYPKTCSKNIRPTFSVFTCSNCNYTFASNQSLQRHVDNEICSKALEQRVPSPRVFICSKCNCTFATNQSLLRHTDSQICTRDIKPVISEINPELFEKWEKAVRRADKRLTATDKICELHFRKEFVKTHDEILLSDGNVFVSKRRKFQLARGAIPTIFPDEPRGIFDIIAKNGRLPGGRNVIENDKTFMKKRRLGTIFGDSLASKSAVEEKQQIANPNSTINFILDDGRTEATEDSVSKRQPIVNANFTMGISDDRSTDALRNSAQELRHAANENPIKNILEVGFTSATNDIVQQLPVLEPNPLADLSDDSITIDDTMLEVQLTGKHNPVTVWIKEEDDDCVDEFTDSTAIENFDDLFHKCSRIEFPDDRWAYAIVANNILITYWSASFDCLKKIIIDMDMKISAFVKDVGIIIDETEVHDLNTVKTVVKKLHEIKECAYNPAKSIRWKCRGFVKQNKQYCSSCCAELEKDSIFKKKGD